MAALAAALGGGGGKPKVSAPQAHAYNPSQATQQLAVASASNPYAMGHAYASGVDDRLRQEDYRSDLAQSNQLAAVLAAQQSSQSAQADMAKTYFQYGHNYPGTTAQSMIQQGLRGGNPMDPLLVRDTITGIGMMQASGANDAGSANKNGVRIGSGTSKALGGLTITPPAQKGSGKNEGGVETSLVVPTGLGHYTIKGKDFGLVTSTGLQAKRVILEGNQQADSGNASLAQQRTLMQITTNAEKRGMKVETLGADGDGNLFISSVDPTNGRNFTTIIAVNGKPTDIANE